MSVYTLKSSSETSLEELAQGICEGMQKLQDKKLKLPASEAQSFKRKLVALLGAKIFNFLAKAVDLATAPVRFKRERLFNNMHSVEDNIGLELSLVPEVECVVIDKQEDGIGLHVLTVVNDRNAEARTKIYKRDQAIIDAYPTFNFDFHIAARMGRNLEDFIKGCGEIAYQRR